MFSNGKLVQYFKYLTCGVGGGLIAINLQKLETHKFDLERGTWNGYSLKAAVPVPVPPPGVPAVPIPRKYDSDLLPPEPEKGINRTSEIMRFGFPSLDTIRSRKDYVISYDRRNRVPNWVFEHLTAAGVARNESVDRQKSSFIEDGSIHPYFRSENSDYKYSGFDRGHLAAAGNHRLSQEFCDETFYLSNMAPQVGVGFNRDKWEHLERYTRKLTKIYKNVYVCSGPLYLPRIDESDGKTYVKYQVIGKNNVAVPTHFFKILLLENENHLELESYVLPNQKIEDSTPLSNFLVPIDSVERAAGLLFFDKIAKHNLVKINGAKV